MSRIQYYHGNFVSLQSYTAAVEVPTLEQVHNLVLDYCKGEQKAVSIPAGLVTVSPKDQYNKKTGRHESLKKTQSLPFVLKNIYFGNDRTTLELTCENRKSNIYKIILELGPNRTKPFLIIVAKC